MMKMANKFNLEYLRNINKTNKPNEDNNNSSNVGKTVKQIAKEIGVSKQAVYKRYKGKLYTEVAPYTYTVDGTIYIKEQGETLIKQDFFKDTNPSVSHTEPHTEHIQDTPVDIPMDTPLYAVINVLKQQLEQKDNQLQNKDTQIERLQKLLDQQQQLTLVQLENKEQLQIENKKPWWKRKS